MHDSVAGILISLAFSAFFSGAEIAFVSTSRLRIEVTGKKSGLQASILSNFAKNPSMFLTTMLVGNNISMVVYGAFFARLFGTLWHKYVDPGEQYAGFEFAAETAVAALIVLISAEFIPKALCSINPYRVLKSLTFPLQFFYKVFQFLGVTVFINFLSHYVLRKVLKVELEDDEHVFGRVDLFHMVNESEQSTKSQEDKSVDTEIFKNALELPQTKIRECMVPRTEIVAIDLSSSIDELLSLFLEESHSKLLIYKDNIDNIIGYVHLIDLFNKPESLKDIILPVYITSEATPANVLLKELIDEHKTLAVVVDEFGGTAGIVSIEDIIEEIFGEIEDEHDKEALTEKRIDSRTFLFSARHEVEYLNEKYALRIPEGDYDTLGGFILQEHQNIPNKGDSIKLSGFSITIMSMDGARIDEVKLIITEDSE